MKMIAKSVKDTSWAITICLFALATAAVAQQNGKTGIERQIDLEKVSYTPLQHNSS